MEQVANALEKRISSLNAGLSRSSGLGRNSDVSEGTSQSLLRAASLDSAAGLRSPGTATPSPDREGWHSGIVADLRLGGDGAEPQVKPGGSSPFAAASRQAPLEETVIVTPARIYHGLTRSGGNRHKPPEASSKPDPAELWKQQRTLLIFWLVTALLTLASSLQWLQVGMWSGLLGFIGPTFSLCGCCSHRKLPLNLQVTRIFAVATSAVSIFATVLFVFLLVRLHCPRSIQAADSCNLFRTAMAMTALWHAFHAGVAALVSARASIVISMFEPIGPRRILVLRSESQASRVLDPAPSARRSAAV